MTGKLFEVGDDYSRWLKELKDRIRSAQVRAALAVNQELVLLSQRDLTPRRGNS